MPASSTVFKGPDVTLCLQPETCRSSTDAAAEQAEAELPQHTHMTPWDHQTHPPCSFTDASCPAVCQQEHPMSTSESDPVGDVHGFVTGRGLHECGAG